MSDVNRCWWCGSDPLYLKYHDEEWGVPLHDDHLLFEFLILETFQAGLSWITVLRKREHFRMAFANFDVLQVAAFTEKDVERLMADAGIIRNGAKIRAAITNAQAYIKVQQEFGSFDRYIWGFVGGGPINNQLKDRSQIQAKTAISDQLSADLKKRGFKFVGSTVVYAHMQATGMVNDHLVDCFLHKQVG